MRSRTEAVDAGLLALVDRVTRRMRAKGRAGRTVVLRLRFVRYARATRSQTLPRATAATRTVLDTGRALLAEARPTIDRRGPTLIRVTVAKLDPRARSRQLDLPLAGPSLEPLYAVVDEVCCPIGPKRWRGPGCCTATLACRTGSSATRRCGPGPDRARDRSGTCRAGGRATVLIGIASGSQPQ